MRRGLIVLALAALPVLVHVAGSSRSPAVEPERSLAVPAVADPWLAAARAAVELPPPVHPGPVRVDAALPGAAAAPAPARDGEPQAPAKPDEPRAEAAAACAGTYTPMRTPRTAYAAVVGRPTDAFRAPGREPLARFELRNVNGVATVLGVLGAVAGPDCEPRWYRVQLPLKPNGVTGYVRAADVALHRISTRILVEIGARRVTLYRDGRKVLEAPAAVGSSATPTPVGSFYVDQRLRPTNPHGPFGPGAIGISAFSEVLTGWAQGGPVALHGTNRPDLIGQAVSNGCIRLRNDMLERMFELALPGTPVEVRA